jgi:hypothetical protein
MTEHYYLTLQVCPENHGLRYASSKAVAYVEALERCCFVITFGSRQHVPVRLRPADSTAKG